MKTIPTAEDFIDKKLDLEGHRYSISFNQAKECAIEFAKLHVAAALEAANDASMFPNYNGNMNILNSYPKTNIK